MSNSAKNESLLKLRWLRRFVIFLVILFALGVVLFFSGGLTSLLNLQTQRMLSQRNYEAAENVILWTNWLNCNNGETAFWEARLRRKLLQGDKVPELLKAANSKGFDQQRVQREYVLLQAQTGKIQAVVDQLNQMMIDPQGDGAEICEAYVNGALIEEANDLALSIISVWKQEFPEDPQPYYAHARLLEYQNQIEPAKTELLKSIEINEQHWPARYALGRLLYDQKQIEKALVQFELGAKMRDNAAPIYYQAKCLHALGQLEKAHSLLLNIVEQPEELIKRSFNRVSEPMRGLPIQLELGLIELALKNTKQAVHWLDIVLAADPRNLEARYSRAVALRELGLQEQAKADFNEVQRVRAILAEVDKLVDEINQNPQDRQVEKMYRVGELFLKHEDRRRGEFWLQRALHIDPTYQPAHALLAEYYTELSQTDPGYLTLAKEHHLAEELNAPPKSESASESKPELEAIAQ